MSVADITGRRKCGRCSDGRELGAGSVGHAVPMPVGMHTSHESALCGAEPGRRSAGWSHSTVAITCKRCIAKLQRRLLSPSGN